MRWTKHALTISLSLLLSAQLFAPAATWASSPQEPAAGEVETTDTADSAATAEDAVAEQPADATSSDNASGGEVTPSEGNSAGSNDPEPADSTDPDSPDATDDVLAEAPDETGETTEQSSPVQKDVQPAIADGYYRISSARNNSSVLDARNGGTANKTAVQIYSWNATDAQIWHIRISDGYATIENVNARKRLDVPSGTATNGKALHLYTANTTNAQRWKIVRNSDGTYSFLAAGNTKLALSLKNGSTSNKTSAILSTWTGSAAQKWSLQPAKTEQQQLDDLAAQHKDDLVDGATYLIRSGAGSSAVLGIAGSSSASKQDKANAQLATFSGLKTQQWVAKRDAKGYFTFKNVNSGKVLDISGGKAVSKQNAQQYASNGTKAQKWIAQKLSDGTFRLVSALDPSYVLDVWGGKAANGTNVQLYQDNGSKAQRWKLENLTDTWKQLDQKAQANASALPDGEYILQTGVGSRKVLDISGASKANGANAQQYTTNMTAAQRWTVSHVNGYVVFTNKASGKALDVSSAKMSNGTNVQQYTRNNSRAQLWIAEKANGAYRISSALYPQLVLDINGASTRDKANLQVYQSNGSKAQAFTPIEYPASVKPGADLGLGNGWYTIAGISSHSYVLGMQGSGTSNGSNVQLQKKAGGAAQLFSFVYRNGYYQIVQAASGKALDVEGGNPVSPTNVQVWTANPSNANQLFAATKHDDGSISFISKSTGQALSIHGGAYASGANIEAAAPNGSAAQRFALVPQENLLKEGLFSLTSASDGKSLLTVENGSSADGAGICLSSANGDSSQKWYVSAVEDKANTYVLECIGSAKLLDANADGSVVQRAMSGRPSQHWIPMLENGQIVLKNEAYGKVLGASNSGSKTIVRLFSQNNTASQRFKLSTADALTEGTYIIRSLSNSAQVVDVTSGSSANKANIQTYQANGSGAQAWDVWKNSDGTYLIKNAENGKALDVNGAKAADGTNVQLYQKNGTNAQKWNISYEHGSGFKISSALDSRFVLGVANGTAQNGANLCLRPDGADQGRRFTFSATAYTPSIMKKVAWKGARYFSQSRFGLDWQALVIHISECPTLDAINNTFHGSREASAHYGVGAGAIQQYVRLTDTAWAVGNWEWNKRTVSIEHVGTTKNPPSRSVLNTSAQLMAGLARQKGWTELVLGTNAGIHKWYGSTTCPATLDVKYLISKANEYMGNGFTYKSVSSGPAKPLTATRSSETLRSALAGTSM